jgi:DNA-binding IclR family transcriptional regulator
VRRRAQERTQVDKRAGAAEAPEPPAERGGASGIQVIARAAEILRLLQAIPAGLSQTEIADRIGLPRSTIHRILGALETEGLVTTGMPRGRYRLGPEIARMADGARHSVVLQVHPYLEELSRELNETVDLSVLDGDQVTFIDQVVAQQRLRAVSQTGTSFPLHCTANGKALLAMMPASMIGKLLPTNLPALTAHTITTPAALNQELDEVRRTGVAFDAQEHTEGICAVGAALHGVPGAPTAVSVPLPVQRFVDRRQEIAAALRQTVTRIEARLVSSASGRGG